MFLSFGACKSFNPTSISSNKNQGTLPRKYEKYFPPKFSTNHSKGALLWKYRKTVMAVDGFLSWGLSTKWGEVSTLLYIHGLAKIQHLWRTVQVTNTISMSEYIPVLRVLVYTGLEILYVPLWTVLFVLQDWKKYTRAMIPSTKKNSNKSSSLIFYIYIL